MSTISEPASFNMNALISWIDSVPADITSSLNRALTLSLRIIRRRMSLDNSSQADSISPFSEREPCLVNRRRQDQSETVSRQMFSTTHNTLTCNDLEKTMYIHNKQLLALFANDEHQVPLSPLDMLYHLIYDVLHFPYEREARIYRILNGMSGKAVLINSSILRRFDAAGFVNE